MRAGALALVLTLSLAGAAGAEAPARSPVPQPRPFGAPVALATALAQEAAREVQAQRAAHAAVAAEDARREVALAAAPPAASPLAVAVSRVPHRRPAGLRAPVRSAAAPVAAGPGERGICGVRGLTGQRLSRITSPTAGCGIAEPVRITAVNGIPLSLAATLDCAAATAFERWVREEMVPAVGNRGGGLARITVVGHYSCRPRNNQSGARISEHGRGRAVDVAGYRLANGETVTVLNDWRRSAHSRTLHRMYEGACGTFRTTLSPNSDRFHQDHFHFDVAQHRGGGTYCR